MSQKVIHRINGKIVEAPINSNQAKIQLRPNETNSDGEPVISLNTWDLEFTNATIINDHVESGANGNGVGIHEGIPYTRSVVDDLGELLIYDGYLNASGESTEFSKETVTGIKSEIKGGHESLSKRAKDVDFRELVLKGVINRLLDFVQIPCVNSTRPDYKGAAIAGLAGSLTVIQVATMAKETSKVVADISGVTNAVAGIIKIVIVTGWIVLTTLTIILMLLNVSDLLIQPVKYHASMLWEKLMNIGANELQYEIETTIFDLPEYRDTVIFPAKFEAFEDANDDNFLGFTTPSKTVSNGEYAGTFFDLLVDFRTTFRAKIEIKGDKLVLSLLDDPVKDPTYRLPSITRKRYKTNASKLKSHYKISFRQDSSDSNTRKNYKGTTTSVYTRPKTIRNPKMVTLDTEGRSSHEVAIPFARGTRKTELTKIEKTFDLLLRAFAPAINLMIVFANLAISARNFVIGKVQNLVDILSRIGINIPFNPKIITPLPFVNVDIISNRIGMLMLENDFTSEPKLLSLDISSSPRNTKLKVNNSDIWHTETLYNFAHIGQSFVPTSRFKFGNQRRIYTSSGFHLCKESAKEIIDNKFIFTDDGLLAEVKSLEWSDETGIVDNIEYWIRHINSRNYVTVLITRDGF